MKEKTHTISEDSKNIQQHLANERTFLAWIRTAIAITGIGFLIINMHIKSSDSTLSNSAVEIIGILSVITGICTIIFSTIGYFMKAKQINAQAFRSSRPLVLFLAMLMLLFTLLFGYYFLITL
ncbi:YidH family protein [Aeribacillus alveayuensis]|uniref:Membrane protein n=1 Tax=Aeribacillus alveayuensis TaxID=279215 RepID=A0ABT9VLN0_9BACI|nr:putative membrane protein [Bacillus alveayuensis]